MALQEVVGFPWHRLQSVISPRDHRQKSVPLRWSAMKRRLIITLAFAILIVPVAVHAQDQRPPRLTTITEDRYRLQPGDVFEVQFRYTPEFNQTVTVQPD